MCNLTGTFRNVHSIDLKLISPILGATWNPKVFATATIRLASPTCCILIFSTGKIVCTGSKSERGAIIAFSKLHIAMMSIYPQIRLTNIKIELINARASLGYPIDLNKMAANFPHQTQYNAALFPGLRYYIKLPTIDDARAPFINSTVLCFKNGNMVITGTKSRYQIMHVWRHMETIMTSYRLPN